MKKSIFIFVFLACHFLSFGGSQAGFVSSGDEKQGIQFKELAPNLHLEMIISEQRFISESSSCVLVYIISADSAERTPLFDRGEEEVFTFGRRTSPRLHLWIKVFRN